MLTFVRTANTTVMFIAQHVFLCLSVVYIKIKWYILPENCLKGKHSDVKITMRYQVRSIS